MQFGSRFLSLSHPRVMGILNVTPDSFYDGGAHFDSSQILLDSCLKKVDAMTRAGVDIVDVGGESTRPGAQKVGLQEECDRVLPVVEAIATNFDLIISVDTSSPQLMLQAAKMGAGLINDVRALEKEGAVSAAKSTGLPVCLMHMQGSPETMQAQPKYRDVVEDVSAYLLARAKACQKEGIAKEQIILDPGIGFGKTDPQNLSLIRSLAQLVALGYPALVGVSRKSLIGRLLNRELGERLPASLALAYQSLLNGARILRVHDVEETVDIVNVFKLMNQIDR